MNYTHRLEAAHKRSPQLASALLWDWLRDDEHRPKLYACLRKNKPIFSFQSCAESEDKTGQPNYRQTVYLLTRQKDIDHALEHFSNAPFKPLGGGSFALSSDNNETDQHEAKREFLMGMMRSIVHDVDYVAALAVKHSMVSVSKKAHFDLVTDLAEQAAVRFVTGLYGYSDNDHLLMLEGMRALYNSMIMQILGRHFVSVPLIMPTADIAGGKLSTRTNELIDEYLNGKRQLAFAELIASDKFLLSQLTECMAAKIPAGIPAYQRYQASLTETDQDSIYAAFELLDQALNFKTVRDSVYDLSLCSKISHTAVGGLQDFLYRWAEEKDAREDSLFPKRFDLNSDGNYVFRKSILEWAAANPDGSMIENSRNDIIINVLGTIVGLIGNITAGTSITINELFQREQQDGILTQAITAAQTGISEKNPLKRAQLGAKALEPYVREALRLQPPAAFIPRQACGSKALRTFQDESGNDIEIPAGAQIIIPMGAATRDCEKPDEFILNREDASERYIFGHPNTDLKSHRCVGEFLSIPLIAHIVRAALLLPGLKRELKDGAARSLEKRWGYVCESFPLRYNHAATVTQRPLNLIMKVKSPTSEHAETIKVILRYGAPIVENLLNQSQMVHFARFVFLNNDAELALFTSYDGDFDNYLSFFADAAGPLFDQIFEHIEDAPPTPVRQHQKEFIHHIRRFDIAPAAEYFYSAYPSLAVIHAIGHQK